MDVSDLVDDRGCEVWHVFHDESGNFGTSKWFGTGLLMVEEKDLDNIVRSLRTHRECEEDLEHDCEFYKGDIHFAEMNYFDRLYSQRSRIGKKWFLDWLDDFHEDCATSISLVDQKSQHLDARFSEPYYGYNKFTSIALKGLISYYSFMFSRGRSLEFVFHSHKKQRQFSDNFGEYFENIIHDELDEASEIPPVDSLDIDLVSTKDHREQYSKYSELIQFTDLLLGSTVNAVSANSEKPAKKWFGKSMSYIINRRDVGHNCVVNSQINFSRFPTPGGTYSNTLNTSLDPHVPQRYQKSNIKDFY
jgi:hypothetical protein